MVAGEGITGPYEGDSIPLRFTIATFLGVAMYNSIELAILVFVTFTRYRGLYFWSLFIAGVVGVLPYSVGFLLKYFNILESLYPALVLLSVGWWIMITGQSFVLYSRLHLVVRNEKVLRRVLIMIIADVFLLHLPTTILTFGSNSANEKPWLHPYGVYEKIQMTGFCIQEFILSTLYIWETIKMLRESPEPDSRRIMYQLITINILFIAMDLALLACTCAELYMIETTAKATFYSIKLKLEFAVLGKLVQLAGSRSQRWAPDYRTGPNGYPDFVDISRLTMDVTHAPYCENSPPKPPWSDPRDMHGMHGMHDIEEEAEPRQSLPSGAEFPKLVIPAPEELHPGVKKIS
jgi:hypothetical protein